MPWRTRILALFVLTNDFPKAEEEYRAAISGNLRDRRVRDGLLKAFIGQGKDSDAERLLAKASNAERAEAQVELGQRAFAEKRLADAERCFSRALELAPERVEIENELGLTLVLGGKAEAALAAFNRVLEKRPNYAPARYNRGMILERNGDLKGALADYRASVARDPQNPNALNACAWLLAARARRGAARWRGRRHIRDASLRTDAARATAAARYAGRRAG